LTALQQFPGPACPLAALLFSPLTATTGTHPVQLGIQEQESHDH
jgi:hypothetical protein